MVDDVALIACGTVQGLVTILCGAAGLRWRAGDTQVRGKLNTHTDGVAFRSVLMVRFQATHPAVPHLDRLEASHSLPATEAWVESASPALVNTNTHHW